MKKLRIFLTACALLLLGSNAFAFESTYFDLTETGVVVAFDGITGEFEELGYDATTTSYIHLDGSIRDTGEASITSFLDLKQDDPDTQFTPAQLIGSTAAESDNEGINLLYQMTFTWDDLIGQITSGSIGAGGVITDTITAEYTSGTINFYLDPVLESPIDYDDGTQFATVSVTGGTYSVDTDGRGIYEIIGTLTVLQPDFWMYYNATTDTFGDLLTWSDLYDIQFQMAWITIETQGDNNDVNFSEGLDNGQFAYVATTNHNSSIRFGINVVPEPTTFLLFGFSLLGLTGILRRRS